MREIDGLVATYHKSLEEVVDAEGLDGTEEEPGKSDMPRFKTVRFMRISGSVFVSHTWEVCTIIHSDVYVLLATASQCSMWATVGLYVHH